jgi:hypothetical protein
MMGTSDGNLVIHGRESIELRVEVIHGIKSLQEMSQSQRLLPSMSQRCSCPDGILDLPAVDVPRRKLPDFFRGEDCANLSQECVPNLSLSRYVEIVEVKSDVDTRAEGIIDNLHPIGRQEEDTTIILEVTQAEVRVCMSSE